MSNQELHLPITPSIAICGGCSNITFETSCKTYSTGWYCNYTLPLGGPVSLENLTNSKAFEEGTAVRLFSGSDFSGGAVYNESDHLYTANFAVIGAPPNNYANQKWSYTVASECALWMCVQACGSKMVNSNLSQSTVQTISQMANLNLTNDPDRGFNYYPTEHWNFQDLPAEMCPRPNANYTVGKYMWVNIVHHLSINVFNGSVLYYPVDQIPSSD